MHKISIVKTNGEQVTRESDGYLLLYVKDGRFVGEVDIDPKVFMPFIIKAMAEKMANKMGGA